MPYERSYEQGLCPQTKKAARFAGSRVSVNARKNVVFLHGTLLGLYRQLIVIRFELG